MDWLRNLRIVFTQKKVSYILNSPTFDIIEEDASDEERAIHKMWKDDSVTVKCIILASTSKSFKGNIRT